MGLEVGEIVEVGEHVAGPTVELGGPGQGRAPGGTQPSRPASDDDLIHLSEEILGEKLSNAGEKTGPIVLWRSYHSPR